MSFIAKSLLSFFNSYSNNPKPKDEINYINNDNINNMNQYQNLFTTQKNTHRTNIFTTEEIEKPGIFSFNDNNSKNNNMNIDNGFPKKNLFNENIQNKNKIVIKNQV